MKTLVVGASGATGSQLVEQLLEHGQQVKAVLRSPEKLPEHWKNNTQLEIIPASILALSDQEMRNLVSDCSFRSILPWSQYGLEGGLRTTTQISYRCNT